MKWGRLINLLEIFIINVVVDRPCFHFIFLMKLVYFNNKIWWCDDVGSSSSSGGGCVDNECIPNYIYI